MKKSTRHKKSARIKNAEKRREEYRQLIVRCARDAANIALHTIKIHHTGWMKVNSRVRSDNETKKLTGAIAKAIIPVTREIAKTNPFAGEKYSPLDKHDLGAT